MVDSFMASTTPFPMSTSLAQSLLAYVEDREQQDFGSWFCKRRRSARISEFAMYAAFLAFLSGGFSGLYHLGNPGPATVWEGSVAGFDKTLMEACKQPFLGVHRGAFRARDRRQRRDLACLWAQRSLFDSEAQALIFIDECAEYYSSHAALAKQG